MAHLAQTEYVAKLAELMPEFFNDCRVLEVGSLDIYGSVRPLFRNCSYLGIDIGPGPGVDLVCQGQDYAGPDGSFDTVISCECMEHNPYWRETFQNMVRLCKPGGLVLMTCATLGSGEHGTLRTTPHSSPHTVAAGWTYYQNLSEADFTSAFTLDRSFAAHAFWTNWVTSDLYFAGVTHRQSEPAADRDSFQTIRLEIDRWLRGYNARISARLRRRILALVGERFVPIEGAAEPMRRRWHRIRRKLGQLPGMGRVKEYRHRWLTR
jgi:SAM-dependent methyltransferase